MSNFEKMTSLSPLSIIVGHYGVGKTNLALNVAFDGANESGKVTLVDLDVVNPYFRSSDYAQDLQSRGVEVVAPNFAGTTLETPSLSGRVQAVIADQVACQKTGTCTNRLIIDAGGDDVGATALGRFSDTIRLTSYDMIYVINKYRNLTQTPEEAVAILHEIEEKSHLKATGIINNSHLQSETTDQVIRDSIPFAKEVAASLNLPLMCTTVPNTVDLSEETIQLVKTVYSVKRYVRTSWDD